MFYLLRPFGASEIFPSRTRGVAPGFLITPLRGFSNSLSELLLPVTDEYERGQEVRVRDLGRRGVAAGNRQAAPLAARLLRVRAAKQFDLCAPKGLGLRHPFALAAQFVELLHQQTRARVGHGPQRSHHGLRALTLREHAEALDLAPVRACAARRRVAGREREEVNAAEEVR